MKTISIELLEKSADELRGIKDGKCDLNFYCRIEAAEALQRIETLLLDLEEAE
ncbi:hypothetical protein [Enterococcus faecium]|uniref:hypothetical protein n=1 Tax=Enterococcus faecium TaxID=1352 RepID=UPI00163C1E81|nr:hypothetical protein [Enterococcus faecium]